MVQTHNGFKRLRTTNNSKNNNKGSNSGTLSDLFKKGYNKGLEFVKNMLISAYDQRKLSFGDKLKTGVFTIGNILSIGRIIIDCYRDGKSFKETLESVVVELTKIISGMFFCHITTSLMETLVDKLLKTGFGLILSQIFLYFTFPPAPALLFIFDIFISFLGGKLVDLLIWLYNKYIKQYAERAFDWIETKVTKAWNWFKSLF